MPKYFFKKTHFFVKIYRHNFFQQKIKTRAFQSQVTFLGFFHILIGTIGKWTKINVQNGKTFVKPRIVFFHVFCMRLKILILCDILISL